MGELTPALVQLFQWLKYLPTSMLIANSHFFELLKYFSTGTLPTNHRPLHSPAGFTWHSRAPSSPLYAITSPCWDCLFSSKRWDKKMLSNRKQRDCLPLLDLQVIDMIDYQRTQTLAHSLCFLWRQQKHRDITMELLRVAKRRNPQCQRFHSGIN